MEKKIRAVDLTRAIKAGMPVFPGDPAVNVFPAAELERDGCRVADLRFGSHTGTHMDAPAHVLERGETLDRLEPERFFGSALAVDCREAVRFSLEAGVYPEIPLSVLEPVREAAEKAEFLLFWTGWESRWGTPEYFSGYPVPSLELCRYLAESGKKGMGLDTASVDPMGAEGLPRHKLLLGGRGMVILENLTNLEEMGEHPAFLIALPLKVQDSDGAPARVAAVVTEPTWRP